MRQQQFVKNAATMTATALVLRAIGIFFRIYLSAQIGAEGMGLYQLIFSIYVLASTFASSGICTAVARLITDELVCGTSHSVRRILTRAVTLSALIGVFSAALIYFAASPISSYFLKDMRAVPSLKVLGVSLPFMGATSCLRGYFMARRKTVLPSVAQIIEQISRILFIIVFLQLFAGGGAAYTCFAVILGDSFAEIVSCMVMSGGYLADKRHIRMLQPTATAVLRPKHGVLYRILAIAAPITAGRYLNSALRTVENILVPNKLTVYSGSASRSLAQFGMLKGMALPLLFFPASFLSSLSTLLIPELSEAHTLGQKNKVNRAVSAALQLTLFISILLGGLFTVFSYDLGTILYGSQDVGFLLRVLAPLMPVMYLESIVDGMLKGLNQQVSSLWYSILDSGSRILLILMLVPQKGMEGFLFIMVLSNLLTSYLNLHRLLKVTGITMRWGQWLLKPALAVSLSAASAVLLNRLLFVGYFSDIVRVALGGIAISFLYVLFSFLLGTLKKEDLRNFKLRRSVDSISVQTHL